VLNTVRAILANPNVMHWNTPSDWIISAQFKPTETPTKGEAQPKAPQRRPPAPAGSQFSASEAAVGVRQESG
jgi:hypothetical protein